MEPESRKAGYDDVLKRTLNRRKPPYYHPLGLEIVEVAKDFARVKMAFSENILNAYGMINGGIVATLADAAVANALLTRYEGSIITTIEFKMNFWRPARTAVYGEARILHPGRRVAVCEADIKDADGRAVAKGLFTYAVTEPGSREGVPASRPPGTEKPDDF